MRAFRTFALVTMLWAGGRALVLSEKSIGQPVEHRSTKPIAIAGTPNLSERAVPLVSRLHPRLDAPTAAITGRIAPNGRPRSVTNVLPDNDAPELANWSAAEPKVASIRDGKPFANTDAQIAYPQLPILRQSGSTRLIAASGYIYVRGSGGRTGLSGNTTLGGSQMAIFADGPVIAQKGGIAFRPFARVTTAGIKVSPQDVALGVSAELRSGRFAYGAAIERRAALNGDGRNALAARATLGLYTPVGKTPLTVAAYSQAGFVGLKRKDGFVEGEVRVAATEGETFRRIRPGIGSWGAMQPGASRFDIGPTLEIPLAQGRAGITVRVDWRFRVSGNARPASGPSLTIATGF